MFCFMRPAGQAMTTSSIQQTVMERSLLTLAWNRSGYYSLFGPRVPFQKRVSRRLLGVWRDIYVIYDVPSRVR